MYETGGGGIEGTHLSTRGGGGYKYILKLYGTG
jgi:hypothetical protein